MENSPVTPSRRQILAVAAATVTLPMLGNAVGALRSARAAASAPASSTAPAGWVATTLKPADLKDNEFTAVTGQPVLLSRADKTVRAFTTKCTHKGAVVKAGAGVKIANCPSHGSQFNLDGTVAKGPATLSLPIFAIRVSDQGFIEVDQGQKPAKDDKLASITIA